jgi:hypothetical protein
MLNLSKELEGRSDYASYAPDLSSSIEAGLIGLTVGGWKVWR